MLVLRQNDNSTETLGRDLRVSSSCDCKSQFEGSKPSSSNLLHGPEGSVTRNQCVRFVRAMSCMACQTGWKIIEKQLSV